MIFVAVWLQKMVGQNQIFPPPLLVLSLDSGSEIRDPGWTKIRIRDKHPVSAALFYFFIDIFSGVQVLARA
jgi:hypothetical protein